MLMHVPMNVCEGAAATLQPALCEVAKQPFRSERRRVLHFHLRKAAVQNLSAIHIRLAKPHPSLGERESRTHEGRVAQAA